MRRVLRVLVCVALAASLLAFGVAGCAKPTSRTLGTYQSPTGKAISAEERRNTVPSVNLSAALVKERNERLKQARTEPEHKTEAFRTEPERPLHVHEPKLTSLQIDAVHRGIRNRLKDPNSAIFGRIVAGVSGDDPNMLSVCGWVNAKNSYGGYTGDRPFMGALMIDSNHFIPIRIGATDSQAGAVLMVCAQDGLSL